MDNLYVSLLNDKLKNLKEVLQETENVALTGADGDMEVYVDLIQKREHNINLMKEIDIKLNSQEILEIKKNLKAEFCKEAELIINQMENIARRITSFDKINESIASKMMNKLKSNIKEININRNVNNAYLPSAYNGGFYFDKKN